VPPVAVAAADDHRGEGARGQRRVHFGRLCGCRRRDCVYGHAGRGEVQNGQHGAHLNCGNENAGGGHSHSRHPPAGHGHGYSHHAKTHARSGPSASTAGTIVAFVFRSARGRRVPGSDGIPPDTHSASGAAGPRPDSGHFAHAGLHASRDPASAPSRSGCRDRPPATHRVATVMLAAAYCDVFPNP
jgi:hypothetical protein